LWKKYLPPGTTVTWDTQVSGPPVLANMLADKDQIGYLGDMPAFVAAAKRNIADIRLVANVAWSPTGHLCSVLLVRSNAPQFANLQQAMRWLNGKTIGVAGKGACGDRYITNLIAAEHIHANVEYLDPTIILTELKNGKLDAAETFQPHIAQLVDEGIGRVVTTGIDINNQDAWFIIMRKDFIDQHPAVALGWLKADIAAWQFIKAHPRKAFQEWQAAVPYYTTKQLWMSFYEQFPGASGASNLNTMVEYSFTPAIKAYIDKSYQFLYNDKILSINKPLPGAIYPKLEEEAVKEMGVSLPLMTFTGQPASAFKIGNSGS
jgi:NitT/TauT family transport system substrate-binding protein